MSENLVQIKNAANSLPNDEVILEFLKILNKINPDNFEQIVNDCLILIKDHFSFDSVILHCSAIDQKSYRYFSASKIKSVDFSQQISLYESTYPFLIGRNRAMKEIRVSSLGQLPPEAATDKTELTKNGIASLISIPFVSVRNNRCGIFACSSHEHDWTREEVLYLKVFSNLLASNIEQIDLIREISESEKKFRTIADYSYDLVSWHLPDGKLAYISPSCERITGYTREEILNNPDYINMLIHPDDLENYLQHTNKHISSQEYPGHEFRIIRKDGEVRWIELKGKNVIGNNGQYIGLRTSSRDFTERVKLLEKLGNALEEIKLLKEKLEIENIFLKEKINIEDRTSGIVTQNPAMLKVLANVKQVALTDSPVLIFGETGTGKELIALAIHNQSSRKNHAMITVNCAAIPPSLIESELFGREKGAYTGAMTKQIGRFELADKSTLFLDEIAELPLEIQSKLLRILQFGEFQMLGSPVTRKVNVRIIAATNRDLTRAVETGLFRKDLFYRLNVFPMTVPPLRDRKEDIPALVWSFVEEFSARMGKRIENISKKSMDRLIAYPWPGNIRELRNIIEYSMILSDTGTLIIHLHDEPLEKTKAVETMEDAERRHILKILDQTNWRIRGRGGAAELLDMNESTLRFRMKKLGISRNL